MFSPVPPFLPRKKNVYKLRLLGASESFRRAENQNQSTKMSYEVSEVPEPYSSVLDRIFRKSKGDFLEYHPGKYIFPPTLALYQKDISEFEVQPDDTWLVSYPRTGKKARTKLNFNFFSAFVLICIQYISKNKC